MNAPTRQSVDVLLVDDNSRDAEFTIRPLTQHTLAHDIIRLKEGPEALDWLRGPSPYCGHDLTHRPKLRGLEILGALLADEPTRLLAAVTMTSSREERAIIESDRLGVNSYIVKPADFDIFPTPSPSLATPGFW